MIQNLCTASTVADFEDIRKLQEDNLRRNFSDSEAILEGFVTAEYSTEFLSRMSTIYPAGIAKVDGKIIGYALIVSKELRGDHALLDDMMEVIDNITFHKDNKLTTFKSQPYVLCGQICVAAGYKGKGLAIDLYKHLKIVVLAISPEIRFCFTEVAHNNKRSLRAHEKCGFKVVQTNTIGDTGFDIVLWDWTEI